MKTFTFGLVLMVSLPTGAETIDDPWPLVPALPTACYGEQDSFSENVAAAIATLDDAISVQDATNDDISNQVGDMAEADPFAMAERMQEYMMSNPEEAMKMMEGLYSTGQTFSDDLSAEIERERELTAPIDDLISRYRAAYAEMRAPTDAQIEALLTEWSEAGDVSTDEAIAQQLPAITRQANTAYEQLCARWWQPGPFPAPLAEYRAFLIDEKVPMGQESFEQGKQQWDIQGVDTSEADSTAAMDAARDYLRQLQGIYVERKEKPSDFHIIPQGLAE